MRISRFVFAFMFFPLSSLACECVYTASKDQAYGGRYAYEVIAYGPGSRNITEDIEVALRDDSWQVFTFPVVKTLQGPEKQFLNVVPKYQSCDNIKIEAGKRYVIEVRPESSDLTYLWACNAFPAK